ncbi:MAG: NUDIX domain-containing protein [Candidatus Pacebacteria bacterium]|nr:NUDIX domain-containing protein [Candidatus Paceibacterota bacterium]
MTDPDKAKELHRIVTTTAIYKKDADGLRFLAIKRSMGERVHPGKWSLVGGGLSTDDYADTPKNHGNNAWSGVVEVSQMREIKEEVGVTIGTPSLLLNFAFIRPDNIPVLVLVYYAPYVSGEVKLETDATEYKWVTLSEAKEMDMIPGIYDELVKVSEALK